MCKNTECIYFREDKECPAAQGCAGHIRALTNYEKYAGTPERFAEFIAALEKEGDLGGYLSHQYCKGDCSETSGDMYCTDDHQKECILRWLNSTVEEK